MSAFWYTLRKGANFSAKGAWQPRRGRPRKKNVRTRRPICHLRARRQSAYAGRAAMRMTSRPSRSAYSAARALPPFVFPSTAMTMEERQTI